MRNPIKTLNDSAKTYVRHQKIHNTEFHRQLDSSCAHKVLFRLQRIRKNKCIYLIDRLIEIRELKKCCKMFYLWEGCDNIFSM